MDRKWTLAAFCLLVGASVAHAAQMPNIIVIMRDDPGYGDFSAYGSAAFETPSMDRLAENGLHFTQGYCSASTCTPTRYTFLTGKYAFREEGARIAVTNTTSLIEPGTTTIASILDDGGYATVMVGKWHLGLGSGNKPNWNGRISPSPPEIGFDYSFLLPVTPDRVPMVYVQNHHVKAINPLDPMTVSWKNQDDKLALRGCDWK